MSRGIIIFLLLVMPAMVYADIASTTYVEAQTASKVDTSSRVKQTLAGTYTVAGTLVVPPPPLPTAK